MSGKVFLFGVRVLSRVTEVERMMAMKQLHPVAQRDTTAKSWHTRQESKKERKMTQLSFIFFALSQQLKL